MASTSRSTNSTLVESTSLDSCSKLKLGGKRKMHGKITDFWSNNQLQRLAG